MISGRTRLFAILADPIAQVKTPAVLNAVMARRGVDGIMVPVHVGRDDLAAVLEGLRRMRNFGGFIATVPHKGPMATLCDEITEAGRLVGAVNAVRREPDGRLVGDMLDGKGFVGGLAAHGIAVAGRSVFLAGAGGAANAIAIALAEAGIARLTVSNRTAARAEDLARRLAEARPGLPVTMAGPDPRGHDLVVNGTSLGLGADDPLPLDAARLEPGQIVAEVIMEPAETPLMAAARARGCRVHPGRPMLEAQAEMMADWLGMVP